MKLSALTHLVCPTNEGGRPCHSKLIVESRTVGPVLAADDQDELVDGILQCPKCGSTYPVICGVAVLIDEIRTYCVNHYSEIISVATRNGVSQGMLSYLQNEGFPAYDGGYTNKSWDSYLGLNAYIASHYSPSLALHPALASRGVTEAAPFFDELLRIIPGITSKRVNASLDIGCNVGGLTWRLSQHSTLVFGVDTSFTASLTARRILLHRPTSQSTYRLHREGMKFDVQQLPDTQRANVEILVSSGLSLPFLPETFDFVAAVNVVDLVNEPSNLIGESFRVLRPGELLLISDPYYWRPDRTPVERWIGQATANSHDAMLDTLAKRGEIVKHDDSLVWLLRFYDRYMQCWANDTFIIRRQSGHLDPPTVFPLESVPC